MLKWFIMTVLFLSVQPITATAAQDKAPGVFARLSFSVEPFDPAKPAAATIKCVVWNNTRSGIHVPVGYDDGYIKLDSGLLNLRRQKVNRDDLKMAWVAGGKEQVVFELPLADIFMLKKDARDTWAWDWRREPDPPLSPIHNYRQPGFRSQAEFAVRIDLGDLVLTSEKATLKIVQAAKADTQPTAVGDRMERFRLIKPGMSMADVERLVGRPERDMGSGVYIWVFDLGEGKTGRVGDSGKGVIWADVVDDSGKVVYRATTRPSESPPETVGRPTSRPCHRCTCPNFRDDGRGKCLTPGCGHRFVDHHN